MSLSVRSKHFATACSILSGLLLPAPRCASGQQSSVAKDPTADMRGTVDALMQPFLTEEQAPGAIVAVSVHGRRAYFMYGTANDSGQPFTPTTLVEIGSCTKVFTATLFALAVDRHQISPDSSIQAYMPKGIALQPGAQGNATGTGEPHFGYAG